MLCLAGHGQQDSALYQLIHVDNDTERVNLIYKAGFELRNTDPQLALLYANTCTEEALKTGSSKHLAKGYSLEGILCYKKGDYTNALRLQQKALALNESVHYDYGIAINQTNLGNIYSDIASYAKAEQSYLAALKAYNNLGNTSKTITSLINIGVLKYNLKYYEPALKQFRFALEMANQARDIELAAKCYNNIGAILMVQNACDSSLVYLEEGLKLLNLQDNEVEMADVYNNLANVYIKKGNPGTAREYLMLADSICKVYDYTEAKVQVYETWSFFYEKQQDYQKANEWLKKYYRLKDSILEISKAELAALNEPETPLFTEIHEQTTFKNGWILVLLGCLAAAISLWLLRYKR
jgi:tetratricopeptide (TPR) repeat protein